MTNQTMRKVTTNQIILAIDPGFDRLGWAVGQLSGISQQSSGIKILSYGCITTDKKLTLFDRYDQIIHDLDELVDKFEPTLLAIEQLFFSKNTKTAMNVSETRGVIIGHLLANGAQVFEYHPNQIKLAVTGNGHADKQAVEKMVRIQLSLKNEKIIDDTIDALAVLLTHSVSNNLDF